MKENALSNQEKLSLLMKTKEMYVKHYLNWLIDKYTKASTEIY